MSPEQAEGRTKEIGPATDIHALGTILYDALTGRPPFLGADPMATILQVRNMEPVPPRRWQPGIPRDLETICLKCLEKAPHRRYASAGDLADDLRRFLVGEPIRARPTSWLEKVWKWSLRRPTAAALIALSAASIVGAVAASVTIARLKYRQAEDEHHNAVVARQLQDLAEKQRDRAQRESARAAANFDAARQAMDVFLTRVGDQKLRNEPRTERLQRELLESAVKFYEGFLKSADGADPSVRREAGWALRSCSPNSPPANPPSRSTARARPIRCGNWPACWRRAIAGQRPTPRSAVRPTCSGNSCASSPTRRTTGSSGRRS
jgi:hypothetical protein